MVIIGISTLPIENLQEYIKRGKELPPPPKNITQKGPYVMSEIGTGMKVMSIYEFDKSEMSEAMEVIAARYAKFFGIPGFTHTLNIWFEVKEALKAVGMG